MTFPRDTEPMLRAVVAALTTHTGQPRCLAPDRLFRLGAPKDVTAPPSASQVYGTPRCWVMPITPREIETSGFNDRMRIEATVEIRCWYHAGDGIGSTAWDRAEARWSRDMIDVANALTCPGALATDPDGNDTGLDGYCLRSDDGRHTMTPVALPRNEATAPVIVQVTHVFRATADLSRPD
jgi:hypothetical protein